MLYSEGRLESLKKKCQVQRHLFQQKRICFAELKNLYKEMGDLYREYRENYWFMYRSLNQAKPDSTARQEAAEKVERFHRKIEDLRGVITKKQQEIYELQRSNRGWTIWPEDY